MKKLLLFLLLAFFACTHEEPIYPSQNSLPEGDGFFLLTPSIPNFKYLPPDERKYYVWSTYGEVVDGKAYQWIEYTLPNGRDTAAMQPISSQETRIISFTPISELLK